MKVIKPYLTIISVFTLCACSQPQVDYTAYVDPYIGSDADGHVFIGANVPFGAVQVGPQNIIKGWNWCSGYHYTDSVVIGFSHTHLSGTGSKDLGDFLVMPYYGELRTLRGEQDNLEGSVAAYYSHDNEQVMPGYYSLLMDNGIHVELTATDRVAFHRYTYPGKQENRLMINLKEGIGDYSTDTYIKKIDDYTVEGYRFSKGWSPGHKFFFTLQCNRPIESLSVFDDDTPVGNDSLTAPAVKGVITFDGDETEILVKVAISSVSCDNAMVNLQTELPGWDFEGVCAQAHDRWNEELACVKIQTPSLKAKRIFYTAMYHTLIAPNLYCDVDGKFRGHDDKIYQATWNNYTVFSLWDTYRTFHPLMTITKTQYVDDMVNSMLSIFDQQGKLPIWALPGSETDGMTGYSAVPIIADAIMKGFNGFDIERAYNSMVASSVYEKQNGVPYVLQKKYIPCDKVYRATSIGMEYAADDWGIALVAKKLGKMDDYRTYLERGKYYALYFDKDINFIRPRMDDGSWRTPYDTFRDVHHVGDFCEGNGWQYTFFVPQHPEGLIDLFGGDEPFINKLDSLFVVVGELDELAAPDITGLIGMYAHGNEPSHHVVYLYPYAGQQWKTAEKVRYIQNVFYTDRPDGLIGNEDCGQMSAWHIMSALGFYQVNPSNGVLVFGSPLFEKASITLPQGKVFDIVAENNNDENIYIQSVTLNGQPYQKSYILYEDIMKGGNLTFVMGNTPNKEFGSAPENRPKTAD